jgi:hypothetical protein
VTSPPTHINRWRAFALLAVAYFMTIVDLAIVNVSLPTIGRDLLLPDEPAVGGDCLCPHVRRIPTARRSCGGSARSPRCPIALLALPAIFTLVRRDDLADTDLATNVVEPRPALAAAN